MPDPRVVYIVAAVVVLALVVWVVVVLVRPSSEPQALPEGIPAKPSTPPVAEPGKTEPLPAADPSTASNTTSAMSAEARDALRRSRPRLDSHLEIQDQSGDDDSES
jgi:negative regulator of sigma E activity